MTLQEALAEEYSAIYAYAGMQNEDTDLRIVILPDNIILTYTQWETRVCGVRRALSPRFEHVPFVSIDEAENILKDFLDRKYTVIP